LPRKWITIHRIIVNRREPGPWQQHDRPEHVNKFTRRAQPSTRTFNSNTDSRLQKFIDFCWRYKKTSHCHSY
jgi:hypothetical protein